MCVCLYFLYLINLYNFSTNLPYDIQLFFCHVWDKNVPEKIKIDYTGFLIYLHQQPLDAKRYKQVSTKATQSNPKQPKATQSNPKQPKATQSYQ